MKTIGLLGGMSWESTLSYYRALNEGVKENLGGFHSAKVLLYSVNFQEIETLLGEKRWDDIARILSEAARRVEAGGADFLLLCTNTMHKVFASLEKSVALPLLHIADATAEEIKRRGYKKVGLLGTGFTMEDDFYRGRLAEKHGIETLVPEKDDRTFINDAVFKELCLGKILENSRKRHVSIINDLAERGAEAVILGCTELALLIKPDDVTLPLLDTTSLHARAAVRKALE